MDDIYGNRGTAGMQAKGFELETKLQAHNTMVVPMLVYGSELWVV